MTADEGRAMDARHAQRTLEAAHAFDLPLRRRITGLTWMVWGLVFAAIFLSYDALSPHFHSFDHATGTETTSPWYVDILWTYWVAAGALTTYALWQSVALRAAVGPRPPAGWRTTGAWVIAGAAGWAITLLVAPNLHPHLIPSAAIGLAWVMLGVIGRPEPARPLRVQGILIGFTILGLAIAADLLVPTPHHDTFGIDIARVAVTALPPFVAGLRLALRG